VDSEEFAGLPLGDLGFPRLVFVDGFFQAELSTLDSMPEGVSVTTFSSALQRDEEVLKAHCGSHAELEGHAFIALNTAFAREGVFLHVKSGTAVSQPIQLFFLQTEDEVARRFHPRNLFVVEDNCELSLIETYLGLGENVYLCNPVTEVSVGDNSMVDHYKIQKESREAFHIAASQVTQGRDSRYSVHVIDVGASIVRNDLGCKLDGEGGLATLNGLYLLNGTQHVDNYTTLEHAKAHCESWELFKGILDNKANGAFRGRIIVREGAQKTDSKQTNQNLLLSDDSYVNTKPQLEIYADDVKCTHGATIGQLDSSALFYLRSRGIPEEAARTLLIYAFASELLEGVKIDPLKEKLTGFLSDWLPEGRIVGEASER
jgi:Fe-S cluster assembly protein SufD